jgi:hypothetical protein
MQLTLGNPLADLIRGGDARLDRQPGTKKQVVRAPRLKNLRGCHSI